MEAAKFWTAATLALVLVVCITSTSVTWHCLNEVARLQSRVENLEVENKGNSVSQLLGLLGVQTSVYQGGDSEEKTLGDQREVRQSANFYEWIAEIVRAELQVHFNCSTGEETKCNLQQGPKGDRGPPGAQGPSGAQGVKGEQGAQGYPGFNGEKGERGEVGEQGLAGERGENGDMGPQGLMGEKGQRGDAGPVGPMGNPGQKGEVGEQGLTGERGDMGHQGPVGEKGEAGDTGPVGPSGAKGEAGLQGKPGEKGEVGEQGLAGERGEKGDLGSRGPVGEKGERGDTGPVGLTGAKGEVGLLGNPGEKGEVGEQGVTGEKGDMGPQGPVGEKGERGDTGPVGTKGEIGLQGNQGQKGEKGDRGEKGEVGRQGQTGEPCPEGEKGGEPTGPSSCGDSTAGWARVAFMDMTNSSHQCPGDMKEVTLSGKRVCGRGSPAARGSCVSAMFSTGGLRYSQVCGRIQGYQYGYPDAFARQFDSIESQYVDGVSVTHGAPGSRKHVWTFVTGYSESYGGISSCPCAPGSDPPRITVPSLVGQDYFCESGVSGSPRTRLYPDDPLWDGDGCTVAGNTCCQFNNPPYFTKQLTTTTRDDLEVRVCGFYTLDNREDTLIDLIELHIKL